MFTTHNARLCVQGCILLHQRQRGIFPVTKSTVPVLPEKRNKTKQKTHRPYHNKEERVRLFFNNEFVLTDRRLLSHSHCQHSLDVVTLRSVYYIQEACRNSPSERERGESWACVCVCVCVCGGGGEGGGTPETRL